MLSRLRICRRRVHLFREALVTNEISMHCLFLKYSQAARPLSPVFSCNECLESILLFKANTGSFEFPYRELRVNQFPVPGTSRKRTGSYVEKKWIVWKFMKTVENKI